MLLNMTSYRLTSGCALIALLAITTSGCSSPGVTQTSVADTDTSVAQTEQAIVRPSKPARIESDEELGLTVKERTRISSGVHDQYSRALALLGQGNTQAGIAALEAVVKDAPELTTPYISLAVAYRSQGQMAEAEQHAKHALLLSPQHPVALNELGIIYRETGRFQLARQSYEQALLVHQDFHFAHRNLAVLCDLFLQDLDCALTHYEAYLGAYPDDPQVKIWIADTHNRMETFVNM